MKLSQTLRRPVGKVSQEVLRLDLSQEFDLRDSHRLADSVAALRFQAGALTGTGQFRYDTQARRPGLVSLEAALQRPRFGVSARFDQLFVPAQSYLPAGGVPPSIGPDPGTGLLGVGEDAFAHPGGSGLQRQTLDALVGSRLAPEVRKGTREQQIVVSGRALLGYGLGLTYTAYFYPTLNGTTAFVDSTNVSHPSQAQFFGQQYLGLTFAPACDCWRLDLLAHFNRPLDGGSPFKAPDFFFNLTISHFGSFGGG